MSTRGKAAKNASKPVTSPSFEDATLISRKELSSSKGSDHLLRSSKNIERLLNALKRALKNKGEMLTLKELKQEVGIETKEE